MLRMTESEFQRIKGRAGGRARAESLSPERRLEIAKVGAASRWSGHEKAPRKTDYARMLAQQIKKAGLPTPVLEYCFDAQLDGTGRSWRFDLAWPGWLAIEVDGGAHTVKEKFKRDIEKHQAAFKLGYKLLRVSPEQVRNGEALELVRRALT